VSLDPVEGKCILITGHDMHDLFELLKQTEGKVSCMLDSSVESRVPNMMGCKAGVGQQVQGSLDRPW
jgi:hypothetical protein